MKTILNIINNKIVILMILVLTSLTACENAPYNEQFIALDASNFELLYDVATVPVVYNLALDTSAFKVAKPLSFKIPSKTIYSIVVDTILGDSAAFITKNYVKLVAQLKPLGAFSPYPVLYPNDAKDGTVRIDYNTLKSKTDAQRAKLAYFKKGKYQVFMKLYTPNGVVYCKNSPLNFEVPSISISAMTSLSQLNYTVGETIPVEGILKVASDDVLRTAVTITLNSTDFEMSETKTGSTTTFTSVSSLTYAPGIELYQKPMYIRLKAGLAVSKNTGTITITHEGQTPIIVNITGEVKPVQVRSSVTELIGLNYALDKGPSTEKSFTVSGDVNDNLVITAPTNFEISTAAASGYTSSISFAKSQGGNVANKLIYVRLKAGLVKAVYTESITISATNALPVSVSLKGEVQ